MTVSSRDFGRLAEDWACRALAREGVRVVERNWSCAQGEIDAVGLDGRIVCIVEVKARRGGAAPAEAVGPRKRRKLVSLARRYLAEKRLSPPGLRFDVVVVRQAPGGGLEGRVIKGAFLEET